MSGKLINKTALITGSAQRIGKSIAEALAKQGADIILHYNNSAEAAQKFALKLQEYNVKVYLVQADLNNNEQVENLINYANGLSNNIDILINNASIFPVSKIPDLTYSELNQSLNVNALAPLILTQQFAKLESKTNRNVINIIDSRINQFDLQHAAYQLSKNMLESITKMCALEYGPQIRVNAVSPGLILPPENKGNDYVIERYKMNILGRAGSLSEITDTILFLLNNNFITGEIINLDGGQNVKGLSYVKS